MPQRPRQHVLEELSERALQQALPAEWVIDPVQRDYGLDRRVEVFQGGRSTGLMFWVQLKATDAPASKSRKLRLPLDQIVYWQGLDMPVLLVRYASSEGGTLYWTWAHTIDPHYGRGEKTYTATIPVDQVLQGDAASRLVNDAQLLRQVRAGDLAVPLPVTVHLPRYWVAWAVTSSRSGSAALSKPPASSRRQGAHLSATATTERRRTRGSPQRYGCSRTASWRDSVQACRRSRCTTTTSTPRREQCNSSQGTFFLS